MKYLLILLMLTLVGCAKPLVTIEDPCTDTECENEETVKDTTKV